MKLESAKEHIFSKIVTNVNISVNAIVHSKK